MTVEPVAAPYRRGSLRFLWRIAYRAPPAGELGCSAINEIEEAGGATF